MMNILKAIYHNIRPQKDQLLTNIRNYPVPAKFDAFQRKALMSPYLRNVVIAGAGAGKTALVVERAKLLVANGVASSKLLFITFTRKATNEMQDRLEKVFGSRFDKSFPQVVTIHSLVNKISSSIKFGLKPHIYSPEIENDPERIAWKNAILDIFEKHPDTAEYLYEICKMEILGQEGLQFNYVYDYYDTKSKYKTKSGDRVRSKGEKAIADFLYENKVDFQYEKPVLFCDWPFRPDFYIKSEDFFIEYLGLWDLEKNDARETYHYCVQQKKAQLDKYKFGSYAYLEIYPSDIRTGEYKEKIFRKIQSLSRLTKRHKYKLTDPKNIAFKDSIDAIVKSSVSLLEFAQTNKLDLKSLKKHTHLHFHKFIDILLMAKSQVDDVLKEQGLMDFKDMFLDLGHNLRNFRQLRDRIKADYSYIFLDEFQDVQPLLLHFIGSLLEELPFFAIGDDRQAIYGFAGGTPYFIRNLRWIFPGTRKFILKFNYRSNRTVVETSQIFTRPGSPRIQSKDVSETKVVLFDVANESQFAPLIISKINELTANAPLMVLSRYRKDRVAATKAYEPFLKNEDSILTFHSSKGLEETAVLVSNLIHGNNVSLSTPSINKDHPFKTELRRVTLQDSPEEEERRLFYVALSRAKKYLFLVTETGKHSPYLKEIANLQTFTFTAADMESVSSVEHTSIKS